MKKRAVTTLLGALGCGGLAAYLAVASLQQGALAAPDAAEAGPLQVVVAARDLPVGVVVRPEDVTLMAWPGESIPAGYLRSPDQVVGHGVLAPVYSNEPLMSGKLAGQGSGAGLPVLIPAGMRAVSVRVDDVIAVAGFVVPGTRVDILVTIAAGEQRGTTSRVVLQNVQVLAAGQSVQPEEGKPQTASVITLLVTPREAEILTLAAAEGRIQLALRNGMDTEVMTTPGAWIRALSGMEAAPPEPSAATRARASTANSMRNAVEIFNGSARTVVTFH